MKIEHTNSATQDAAKHKTLSIIELINLFNTHRSELVDFARRIASDTTTAEDMVHEAFLRIQAKMRGGQYSVQTAIRYYHLVIRNISIDWRRRTNYEKQLFTEDVVDIEDVIPEQKTSLLEAVIAKEELALILDGLEDLPLRTRMALEMYRFGSYTMQSIAEHFNISKSTASVLVMKGMVVCRRCRAKYNRS